MKLGRLPHKHDPRTLKFEKYLTPDLPAPPDSFDTMEDVTVPWGMLKNDQVGDCTCAAAGHAITSWIANATGCQVVPADDAIIKAYEDVSGYRPWLPWSDQGANELDVLKYWKNTGIAGHQIAAFIQVDHTNILRIKQAMYIFGGVYSGIDMPRSVSEQFNSGLKWDVPSGGAVGDGAPGSWGGHAVWMPGRYGNHYYGGVSWGEEITMTEAFVQTYFEEAWAIISTDFLKADKSPQGFDLAQLNADLAAIAA